MRPFLAAVLIALATLGCRMRSVTSPTASTTPTPAAPPATVTVQVLTRDAEQPIAGATVSENDNSVGQTDRDGMSRISVTRGVNFHVSVTAAGYVSIGAWGAVASDEFWQFYLERQR